MKTDHQWRQMRRRNSILPEIKDLAKVGFTVRAVTPYQYRINESLDLYPTNYLFHNLNTGKRGTLDKGRILEFVQLVFAGVR